MDLAYFGGCHRSNRHNWHNLLVSERWETVELVMETSASDGVPIFGDEECLKERKWWCFLLSSIFTFLLGIFYFCVNNSAVELEMPCQPSKTRHALPLYEMCDALNVELRGLFLEEIPPVPGVLEESQDPKLKKKASLPEVQSSGVPRGGSVLPKRL